MGSQELGSWDQLRSLSDNFLRHVLVIFIFPPLLPIYHCSSIKIQYYRSQLSQLGVFQSFLGFWDHCVHFVTTFSDMFQSISSFHLSFRSIIALLHFSLLQVRTVMIRSCIDLLIGLDLSGVNPTKVRTQKKALDVFAHRNHFHFLWRLHNNSFRFPKILTPQVPITFRASQLIVVDTIKFDSSFSGNQVWTASVIIKK